MGGVTNRKDGRVQVTCRYRDEHDCSQVKYFYGKTAREATEKMRNWKARGADKLKGDYTMGWLMDHLVAEGGYFEKQRRQKANTLFDYRAQSETHVKPKIGGVKLSRLTVGHLDSVPLDMMATGRSAKTAKNVQNLLKMCVTEGKRQGYVPRTLDLDLAHIDCPKFRAKLIDITEMAVLIEAAKGRRVQTAILLAGFCGLRQSEIAGLMWRDVDGDALTIARQYQRKRGGGTQFDDPKTEAGIRVIALPAPVVDHLACLERTSLYILPSLKDASHPVDPTTLYHETMQVLAKTDLKKIRFHDLRHSANNILKQLGVDSATRRDILGHSTVAVTDNIYTQTTTPEMVDAMKRLVTALKEAK